MHIHVLRESSSCVQARTHVCCSPMPGRGHHTSSGWLQGTCCSAVGCGACIPACTCGVCRYACTILLAHHPTLKCGPGPYLKLGGSEAVHGSSTQPSAPDLSCSSVSEQASPRARHHTAAVLGTGIKQQHSRAQIGAQLHAVRRRQQQHRWHMGRAWWPGSCSRRVGDVSAVEAA